MVRLVLSPPTASLIPIFVVSVCICVCFYVYICVFARVYVCICAQIYVCLHVVCLYVCIYICNLCIYLQILLRAYVFESHKISIYKKIVVFSVFLPENYLDEVAI